MKSVMTASILFLSLNVSAETWQNEVLAEFREVYKSYNLNIVEKRESPLASAGAEGDLNHLKILVEGGVYTSPRVSPDGLRAMLCHEIGHLLGGAPRKSPPIDWDGPVASDGLSFLSSEGQADYYASRVCFRKMVRGQDHQNVLDPKKVTPRLRALCEEAHGKNTEDSLICMRAALGGENMLNVVKDFDISFETPETDVVSETNSNTYPSRQCRLDTFVAGALCPNQDILALDFMKSEANDCKPAAARPACWFVKP